MVFKGFFFPFNKQVRDYSMFIKGMYNVLKRSLVALFFEQLSLTEEIHAN